MDLSVPPGKLRITVTRLQMTAPPRRRPVPVPLGKVALLQAERPTVSFYRYLYDTVGEPWLWSDRRALDDAALRDIIHDPRDTLEVLYLGGVPAGFAELFRRGDKVTEISYFGLIPDFIGQGLGRFLLQSAVDLAWRDEPDRVTVETCDLDHPKAVALYQWAGFAPYGQEALLRDDPRVLGLIPRAAAPRQPIVEG